MLVAEVAESGWNSPLGRGVGAAGARPERVSIGHIGHQVLGELMLIARVAGGGLVDVLLARRQGLDLDPRIAQAKLHAITLSQIDALIREDTQVLGSGTNIGAEQRREVGNSMQPVVGGKQTVGEVVYVIARRLEAQLIGQNIG